MANTVRIDISISDEAGREILIAELSDNNYYAFEESDNLSAFIKEEDYKEDALAEILKGTPFQKLLIADANWNEKWESDFTPVIVEQFVGIRAGFHKPVTAVKHEIIITPKMSFGTGHHATTYLMIQQMEHMNFENKKVLDFGTGTGVLAILADKLGAQVTAIDNDDWSITNAKENIEVNKCSNVTLSKADAPPDEQYDIILANINLNIIMASLQLMKKVVRKEGYILISGILSADITRVKEAFGLEGLEQIKVCEREGWACISFQMQQ